MLTPRNKIQLAIGYHSKEAEVADSVYEICDSEFNSRNDIHNSFLSAKGEASWARHYLLHEIRKVAIRENLYISVHVAHQIGLRIANDWFKQKEIA